MPEIIAAVVSFVVTVVTTIGASKIGQFALKIAFTVAAAAAMRALQPKPRSMNQGATLSVKLDPAYPREVMVGKGATGGSEVFKNVSGTDNKYLWKVIALSDAEIEAIDEVRGNGAALTFSGDIHTGLRDCTSHFQSASGGDMLACRIYKGTSTQTADSDLDTAFSDIDSNFRGRGVAYTILRLTYDPDAWSGGIDDFVFVGRGAKCLDPRTGASAYTDNLALIANQYLRGFENNGIRVVGVGCAAADLPDADMIAAADDCEDAISLAAGGTEARYRGGGMISARENAREVMTDLMAGMAGRHVDRGGEIALLPGVARTPVLDIAEEDLLADEGVTWVGRRSADERFNAIASTFVNPDDSWQEAPLPPRKNAAAITADGGRFETGRAYRFVTSKTQGQRLDEAELRRARAEGFWAVSAPLWAFELTPGDLVTATNVRWGSVQKLFEVETVALTISSGAGGGGAQARCALTMRETTADIFTWATTDEITQASGGITTPAPLAAIPTHAGNAAAIAAGLVPGQTFYDSADTTKLKSVVSGSATGFSVSISPATNNKSGTGALTSTSHTTTITNGGGGPYTYLWEKVTEDAGAPALTINTPAGSSTTFTCTPGAGNNFTYGIRLTLADAATGEIVTATCSQKFTDTT